MEKRIAIAFYIGLCVVALGIVWVLDAAQTQPSAEPAPQVKSQSIELDAKDVMSESPSLQHAIEQLSQPVKEPTTEGMGGQLQPATTETIPEDLP